MRKSLLWKLTLAFMLVALTTAGLVAVLIRQTSVNRLTQLIVDQQRSALQASLSEYYQATGSWNNVTEYWPMLRTRSFFPTVTQNGQRLPPIDNFRDRRRLFGLTDAQGRVLIAIDSLYPAGATLPASLLKTETPVTVNNKPVGYITTIDTLPGLNPEENLFLQRTNQALMLAVVGALIVALAMGVILASTLIRPLHALTDAAHSIARGELDQEVKVNSQDEIGELAVAFNRMSQEVTRVNQLRRQMTADIAHDLRTPLTVIGGYVESMRDGVLQPTPERLSLIYKEIERLQNLVGDLKMLSQADSGELPLHPQAIAPKNLLEQAAAPFQHRAEQQQVRLSVEAEKNLPEIKVDEARMMQVFGNLISNALRYTQTGGQIRLSATASDGYIVLKVQDNGEGIAEEDLPFVFDRFHRADKSRHTETGESGLGLAIVKALVEAHSGNVRAESKPGEGTSISIILPCGPAGVEG